MQDVLKREVVEGEKADEARKKVNRAANKPLRTRPAKAPRQESSQTQSEMSEPNATETALEGGEA